MLIHKQGIPQSIDDFLKFQMTQLCLPLSMYTFMIRSRIDCWRKQRVGFWRLWCEKLGQNIVFICGNRPIFLCISEKKALHTWINKWTTWTTTGCKPLRKSVPVDCLSDCGWKGYWYRCRKPELVFSINNSGPLDSFVLELVRGRTYTCRIFLLIIVVFIWARHEFPTNFHFLP